MLSYKFDIILGDFNIDALESNVNLNQFLTGYTLVVNEPTHISGSLLDHCYIKNDVLQQYDILCHVITVPFSDHDAVRVNLKMKFLS